MQVSKLTAEQTCSSQDGTGTTTDRSMDQN